MPAIESQVRRPRLRYSASLIKVAQPSVAALLSVGRKAPADWARVLLVDLGSLRTACPLFRNLGDPSTDWERWCALLVTPVGNRAMRLSQTHDTNWREAHYISTVDLPSTFPAELPPHALLCPEFPHEIVRVFTSEKARQAHRARAHEHRAMARTSSVMSDAQRVATSLVHAMAVEHLEHNDADARCWTACYPNSQLL